MSSLHRMHPPTPLRPHSTPSRNRCGRRRYPENPRRNGLRINLSLLRRGWDMERLNSHMNNNCPPILLRRITNMKKYDYQTCLRLPVILKEEMTTICDEYHINESDLMRKAIVQFVENVKRNPDQHSRYMFV